jgi:hypothetical protein
MYKVKILYGEFFKMIYILAIRHVIPRSHTNMAIIFAVNFVIIENWQEKSSTCV